MNISEVELSISNLCITFLKQIVYQIIVICYTFWIDFPLAIYMNQRSMYQH
jgi:hypothetical protein